MELQAYECKNCGAGLDLTKSENGIVQCKSCKSVFTIPKKEVSPAALSFLRQGEHDLDTGKFDDAYSAFSKAAQYDKNEPEAYWGMALAEFKVRYIKDIVNNRLQPICYEFTDKEFVKNKNYIAAVNCATEKQRNIYESKAQEIDYIRSAFLQLKQSDLDYDCFICVKVSRLDAEQTDGTKKNWTDDAYNADAIYDLLKRSGFNPFFSEREIRGRSGADYEAMILYALYTSETMIVVCSNEEYLRTPWVQNEYSRFKALVQNREKENDSLTIVFNRNPIERLPGENYGKIQGIDYSRREADLEIVRFVESHTPLAKAKREEEKRKKDKTNEELTQKLAEMEQAIKERSSLSEIANDEFFAKMDRARAEREKAERELRKFVISGSNLEEYKGNSSEVVIPDGVKTIKANAFCNGNKIISIIIPEGVTSIEEWAFSGCSSLTSITIPSSITHLHENAFSGCYAIKKIKFNNFSSYYAINSVMGSRSAFGLIGEFEKRNVYIGEQKLSELTSITIPSDITSIDAGAFYGCSSLTSIIIPDNVTSIGAGAFSGCSSLISIIIPDNVTSIGAGAFSGCSSLTTITIPKSVTSIGARAFFGCGSLTNITIPSTVLKIGEEAFSCCKALTIYCEAPKKPRKWKRKWNKRWSKNIISPEIWNCKDNDRDKYGYAYTVINGIRYSLKEGKATVIMQPANITIAAIPEKITYKGTQYRVTSIIAEAFQWCGLFASITIPSSVTRIEPETFYGCSSLMSITIPSGVRSIGIRAFSGCKSLVNITIPSSVTYIEEYAFSNCESLTTLLIPNSVTKIGEGAFGWCHSLTNVTIPKKFKWSKGKIFKNDKLEGINITYTK